MKRRYLTVFLLLLAATLFAACDARSYGSLKSVTMPFIAQYECTDLRLGEQNLLEDYDYIRLTFEKDNVLELTYKEKDGVKKTLSGKYELNPVTRELSAEIGILGYKFKEKTVVERGKFTVSKPIGGQILTMTFSAA